MPPDPKRAKTAPSQKEPKEVEGKKESVTVKPKGTAAPRKRQHKTKTGTSGSSSDSSSSSSDAGSKHKKAKKSKKSPKKDTPKAPKAKKPKLTKDQKTATDAHKEKATKKEDKGKAPAEKERKPAPSFPDLIETMQPEVHGQSFSRT